MDKKKTLIQGLLRLAVLALLLPGSVAMQAQGVKKIQFCNKKYEYGIGRDSITLFFNLLDGQGKRVQDLTAGQLDELMAIKEGDELIPSSRGRMKSITDGERIPEEYTFSIMMDLTIPRKERESICQAIEKLVESAPAGCVYLSTFGDVVSSSIPITKENLDKVKSMVLAADAKDQYLYGALYAKLAEFSTAPGNKENAVVKEMGYERNATIAKRAVLNRDKNILFVFAKGDGWPSFEELEYFDVEDQQKDSTRVTPTVYAFYYTHGSDLEMEQLLKAICEPGIEGHQGVFKPASDMKQVVADFMDVVRNQMYDFSYTYRVDDDKVYMGVTKYSALWHGEMIGTGEFMIGAVEHPWPDRAADAKGSVIKYVVAIFAALLTILFFIFVMKVLVPLVRARAFRMKYYTKYVPEAGVNRRICYYCKQVLEEGQPIVAKCKHVMHVHCWKQNGYKCAEYGQNCKTGIQEHVVWKELLAWKSVKDCYQAIAGIFAGFVSWLLFELAGRGIFGGISSVLVGMFYHVRKGMPDLTVECVAKTSAFLSIGLLLGFFLSLIFRLNDEYRRLSPGIVLKAFALSLLNAVVGMVTFGLGGCLLCVMLTSIQPIAYIPWYLSLPAYLLFSICVPLMLTVQSSIPLKSALLGGLGSALLGFAVLCFSGMTGYKWPWMNMLLDFIIYGGGLGASLVTVRMLAERYFLEIKNGVRAGQLIPIHKWMNATGGGNKVTIGMTGDCEIQMNWEKSNNVAKEHAQLYVDPERQLPMLLPLAPGVMYNNRAHLTVGRPAVLSNNDTFSIGDTIFMYVETE